MRTYTDIHTYLHTYIHIHTHTHVNRVLCIHSLTNCTGAQPQPCKALEIVGGGTLVSSPAAPDTSDSLEPSVARLSSRTSRAIRA